MTGERKSSDLSSRLNVKRGGKLISKTLGKSSSPPSISTPPKAAVGASKVKKDDVQRRKNSFQDMLRGSSKEKDGGRTAALHVPVPTAPTALRMPESHDSSSQAKEDTTPNSDIIIKELQGALAAARDEATALKQELERVKQDAQASVEVSKYQATEAIQQQYEHQKSDSRMYDQSEELHHSLSIQEEDLINQNHDLRYRLSQLQDRLTAQSATHPLEPSRSEADWDALTLRLHETEKESSSRLQQLLSLKSSISSLTRIDSQVSDSDIAESFLQLANRVREWVISNYRRTKMNLHDLPDTTMRTLQLIKVDYENTKAADKLALYQAIVSQILMRIFNELVVVGMPGRGLYAGVRGFSAALQGAGAEFYEWRRATLRAIEKSGQELNLSEWRDEELQKLAKELEYTLLSISSAELLSSARATLINILNAAADLQRTLCLQKAQYRVVFFDTLKQGDHHFDNRMMEPVNDLEYSIDEGSDHAEHKFLFCVFPCLQKFSNEISGDTYLGNVISKARVCCGVG